MNDFVVDVTSKIMERNVSRSMTIMQWVNDIMQSLCQRLDCKFPALLRQAIVVFSCAFLKMHDVLRIVEDIRPTDADADAPDQLVVIHFKVTPQIARLIGEMAEHSGAIGTFLSRLILKEYVLENRHLPAIRQGIYKTLVDPDSLPAE